MEIFRTHRAIAANGFAAIVAWMTISTFAPISAQPSLTETAGQQLEEQVVCYSNTWAVEVHGGAEEADVLAQEHGLINRGQVIAIRFIKFLIIMICRLVIKNTTTCSWKGRLRGW